MLQLTTFRRGRNQEVYQTQKMRKFSHLITVTEADISVIGISCEVPVTTSAVTDPPLILPISSTSTSTSLYPYPSPPSLSPPSPLSFSAVPNQGDIFFVISATIS